MARLLDKVLIDPKVPYSLKTDGNLELVFYGVGSMFAERPLRQTGFLLCKGDTHIMVDAGRTAPEALVDATGVKFTDIQVMLPTHSHPDHVNAIGEWLTWYRYIGIPFLKRPRPITIIGETYMPILWNETLRGGVKYNERIEDGRKYLNFGDMTDFIIPKFKVFQPREVLEVDFGGIHLELFRTVHVPDSSGGWEDSFISYGLVVDDHLFISGDTRFDRGLLQMYERQSSAMFCDVQFYPAGVHAPLNDYRGLPGFVKEKTYFIHYSNDYHRHDIPEFGGWAKQGVRYIFG
ncbi:MAG: MBL fold metallo-hydrolase [bacterium]|nr:MBL fold metallo-hydrolase [bacterium]